MVQALGALERAGAGNEHKLITQYRIGNGVAICEAQKL